MGESTRAPDSGASLTESLATLLAGQLAPEAFAEASIVLIGNWVNAEVAVLLRWEPAAEHLTFLTSAGLKSRVLMFLAEKVGNGIGLECLRQRQSRLIPQAAKDPRLPAQLVAGLVSEKGLSVAVVPLHHEGEPAGVVLLFGSGPGAFSPYRLEVLSRSLGVVAEALVEGRVQVGGTREHGAGDRQAGGDHGNEEGAATVTAELASLWQERDALLRREAALQKALNSTRDRQMTALAEVRQAVEAADSRTREAMAEAEALKAERKNLQEALAAATAGRLKQEGEVASLRAQIATLHAANADVQVKLIKVAELQSAVDAARTNLKAKSETIEALGREREELTKQLNLARMVAHRRGQAAPQRAGKTPDRDQVEELSEALAAGTAARLHLEVELARLREQVIALQGERTEAQAWAEQRAKDLAAAQANIETAQARLAVARLDLDQVEVQRLNIAELRAEVQSLRISHASLERERNETRKALDNLRASVRAAAHARAPIVPGRDAANEGEAIFSDADIIEDELRQAFLMDAEECRESCEQLLLRLEAEPTDHENRQALFRAFHTLKGSAASAGFAQLAGRLHEAENLIEGIEHGERAVDAETIDLLFQIPDALAATVAAARGAHLAIGETGIVPRRPSAEVRDAISDGGEPGIAGRPGPGTGEERATVRVESARLESLLDGLGQLGSTRQRIVDEFRSLMALRDKLRGWRERAGTTPGLAPAEGAGDVRQEIDDVLNLVDETGTISEEFSRLIDVLAEEGNHFFELSSGLEKEVGDLRLARLESVFRRLHRPVRDAARQTKKLVDFVVRGGELEIDRSLADALYSPLLHLVRNAVTHGIETPEVREQHRKPRTGTVCVEAAARDGELNVSVTDDGAGINLDRVYEKAITARLVNPNRIPTRDQLLSLIFRPGFSTTDGVSDLAGRGVGMDVVAQQAKAVRGRVSLDSEDGRGTSVVIKIPLPATQSHAA